MAAAAPKRIRVISLDYDACLSTSVSVAECTLHLVKALLLSPAYSDLSVDDTHSEKALLINYKEYLEGLLAKNISPITLKHGLQVFDAKEGIIFDGLTKYRKALKNADLATLMGIFTSDEAKALAQSEAVRNAVNTTVIKYQRNFIEILKSENTHYTKTIVYIGSNRQSPFIDKSMAHNRPLVYRGQAIDVIPAIAKELEAIFDPLLLKDVFPGNANHSVMDDDKVMILYAQAQKAQLDNPDAYIDFQFYDDLFNGLNLKAYADIGERLLTVIGTGDHPTLLLPVGMVLHLRLYNDAMRNFDKADITNDQACVTGSGPVDPHFAATITDMIESASMHISTSAPPVRSISIGPEGEKQLSAEVINNIVAERACMLPGLVLCGNIGAIQAGILIVLVEELKKSHKDGISATDHYRALIAVAHLLERSLPLVDKTTAIKEMTIMVSLRELFNKLMKALPKAGAAVARAGISSTVLPFATATIPALKVDNAAKNLIAVIEHLVGSLEAGELNEPSSTSTIIFNGSELRVPDGIARIYAKVLSMEPAATKLLGINTVLAEKAASKPWFTKRDSVTERAYEGLQVLISGKTKDNETSPSAGKS
ncbi:MAG: hypothetical protein Q7V63_01820 [Gammaproteobacteria bacterium]|nr:hypothetical protein [Gammaproteobacteria bacterium]